MEKIVEQKTTHQKFSESVAEAVRRMREATPEEKVEIEKTERMIRYHAAVNCAEFEKQYGLRICYGVRMLR